MTILVTGATGTVGTEVVKQLSKSTKVRAAVHSAEKAEKIKAENVEIVELDLNNIESIKKAVQGVEKIFLLTPVVQNPTDQVKNVIEAAKKADVKYIVRMSAYWDGDVPDVKILKWHDEAEQIVKNSGIPYTILKPNYFMQNFLMMAAQSIKEQNSMFLPYADAKISLIDVRDIGTFAAKILTEEGHDGKTYRITGPEELSMVDAAKKIGEAIGKEVKYIPVPDKDASDAMKGMGLPDWLVAALIEFAVSIRNGKLAPATNTFEEVTGQKATSLDQFAKDFATAFK